MHSVGSILDVLDQSAASFVFPMLDNGYVYLAATRLAVFRSDVNWAITFEIFGFSPRAGIPNLNVTTIGSSISGLKTQADFVNEQAYKAYLSNSANSHLEFFHPIEDNVWIDPENGECVAADADSLVLRGHIMPLPDLPVYDRAGIKLIDPPSVQIFELSRALAYLRRSDVLASKAEREVNLPGGMRELLVLDDWLHPDVVDADCLPSRSTTFQQLAAVISTGEISRYVAPSSGNTHWSNWPDGGTL